MARPTSVAGSTPASSSRRSISRAAKPASIRSVAPSWTSANAFPFEPLPRTCSVANCSAPAGQALMHRPERSFHLGVDIDFTAGQHPARDLQESVGIDPGFAVAPGERSGVAGGANCTEDVCACPHHRAGRQQGANRSLGVIADERAEHHPAGVEAFAGWLDTYGTVSVLEVRSDRAGTKVDPRADRGVTHETVVCLVGIAIDHGGRHLAVDPAVWPDTDVLDRTAVDDRALADPAGALEASAALHRNALFQDHGAA